MSELYICPDCIYVEDPQYTCTMCWSEGGNGVIDNSTVREYKLDKNDLVIYNGEYNER